MKCPTLQNNSSLSTKYPFQAELELMWLNEFGEEPTPAQKLALRDATGDTYFEMRKMTSKLLSMIERFIIDGKYAGYYKGEVLTAEQKKSIINGEKVNEDMKTSLRKIVDETWMTVLSKQKEGVERLLSEVKNK